MLLASYILVWPAISAAVLVVLLVALWRDLRRARKSGKEMI
nr:putative transporter small subunit [Allopusillimonas soli]